MFLALVYNAICNISDVYCRDVLFATKNLSTDRCSSAAILPIRNICVKRFCLTSNGVKIGVVMSLTSGSLFRYYSIHKVTVTELLFEHRISSKTDENVK